MDLSIKPQPLPPLLAPLAAADKEVAAPAGFADRLEQAAAQQADRKRSRGEEKPAPATEKAAAQPAEGEPPQAEQSQADDEQQPVEASAETAADDEQREHESDEVATESEAEVVVGQVAIEQAEVPVQAAHAAEPLATGDVAVSDSLDPTAADQDTQQATAEARTEGDVPASNSAKPPAPEQSPAESSETSPLPVPVAPTQTPDEAATPAPIVEPVDDSASQAEVPDETRATAPVVPDSPHKTKGVKLPESQAEEAAASDTSVESKQTGPGPQSAVAAATVSAPPAEEPEAPKAKSAGRSPIEPSTTPADAGPKPGADAAELASETEPELSPELSSTNEPREKHSPRGESFQSIVERATSPSGRRSAPAESDSNPATRVDAARFVHRVANAFRAAEDRGGVVQLRLSPPELGAMKVELQVQQGVLTAKLETETAAAKSVLLDNLPALKDRLAAQEIRIEKFEVDVRQHPSGGEPDWQAQQDSRDASRHPAPRPGQSRHQAPEAPTATTTESPRSHHDGQFSAVA